jgi:hypothetical protein
MRDTLPAHVHRADGGSKLLQGLGRRFAVWRYRAVLPRELVRRYGRSTSYTPAQVLATIRATRLSEHHAVYACALFCSKRVVREYAEKNAPHLTFDNPAGVSIAALLGASLLTEYDTLRAQIGAPSQVGDASETGGSSASAWGDAGGEAATSDAAGDGVADGGGND